MICNNVSVALCKRSEWPWSLLSVKIWSPFIVNLDVLIHTFEEKELKDWLFIKLQQFERNYFYEKLLIISWEANKKSYIYIHINNKIIYERSNKEHHYYCQ
jgi:hypothetical protein